MRQIFLLLNFTASVDFVATQNKKTNGQNLVYLINGDYLLLEKSAFEKWRSLSICLLLLFKFDNCSANHLGLNLLP